jgi:hypothetical protein
MERLGAGLEGSGKTYKELKAHPFFEGVDWATISASNDLLFDKSEALKVL